MELLFKRSKDAKSLYNRYVMSSDDNNNNTRNLVEKNHFDSLKQMEIKPTMGWDGYK